ncbi:hypothetical protein [Bacillus toyonensis]|uniref:hypothetical protein n=1 Tax=Bacillus toyonensis TaxID=155322 RepID=UPI000BF738D2|nr:hypothetical protein [Bacillus toyonensis]PGF05000.1 hypothetical protein COM61_00765 [Bacillus toyonensis]
MKTKKSVTSMQKTGFICIVIFAICVFYLAILGYENKDLYYKTIGFTKKLSLGEEILYSYFYTTYYLFQLVCFACITTGIFQVVRGQYVNVYQTFKTGIRILIKIVFYSPLIVCAYISVYLQLNLFTVAIGVCSLFATGIVWLTHKRREKGYARNI